MVSLTGILKISELSDILMIYEIKDIIKDILRMPYGSLEDIC